MSSSDNCGPPEARGSDDDLRGLEILLVEDSQSVADALKQHLELLGAQRIRTGSDNGRSHETYN